MTYFKNNILAYTDGKIPRLPKVKRVIWFVRHGERIDNDKEKKKMAKNAGHFQHGGRKLELDNFPLNDTGKERAKKLEDV